MARISETLQQKRRKIEEDRARRAQSRAGVSSAAPVPGVRSGRGPQLDIDKLFVTPPQPLKEPSKAEPLPSASPAAAAAPENTDAVAGEQATDEQRRALEDERIRRERQEACLEKIRSVAMNYGQILIQWRATPTKPLRQLLLDAIEVVDMSIDGVTPSSGINRLILNASKRTIQEALERVSHLLPSEKLPLWQQGRLIFAALGDVCQASVAHSPAAEGWKVWDEGLRDAVMSSGCQADDLEAVVRLVQYGSL
jgi:hypothetical protein